MVKSTISRVFRNIFANIHRYIGENVESRRRIQESIADSQTASSVCSCCHYRAVITRKDRVVFSAHKIHKNWMLINQFVVGPLAKAGVSKVPQGAIISKNHASSTVTRDFVDGRKVDAIFGRCIQKAQLAIWTQLIFLVITKQYQLVFLSDESIVKFTN